MVAPNVNSHLNMVSFAMAVKEDLHFIIPWMRQLMK